MPLFVEELTKAVLETGETGVPASLRDSLMARLDRLPEVKEIAQTAACIGREFSHALLAAVACQAEAELNAALDQLAGAEIVFHRGAPPDTHYTFKHALVRDAAYQSLLRSKRQALHAQIAEALESRFPDTAEAQPELLGHHHTLAGDAEQAVGWWTRAAERAVRTSANVEAIGHYRRALEQLATLPPSQDRDRSEIDLQLGLGAALIAPRTYAAQEVRQAFASAEALSQRMNDDARHFRALRGLWAWHTRRANLGEAARLAEQLSELGERSEESACRLMACRIAGTTSLGRGRYRVAKAEFGRGLKLYEPNEQDRYVLTYGEDPGLFCHVYSS